MNSPRRDAVPNAALARLDWEKLSHDLDACGNSIIRNLLEPSDCTALIDMYRVEGLFRNKVVMARHGFGRVFARNAI